MKEERSTYDQALTILEYRARSIDELRRKLIQKGAAKAEVEEVLVRLIDQKLLDDAEFARQFARTKITGSGASKFRIMQELRRKGVAAEVAQHALDELHRDEGIEASASIGRIAEKKWRSLGKLDEPTRRRRLYAFLARRGYSPDDIRTAMASLGARPEEL